MSSPRSAIGIDLGTTNCALALSLPPGGATEDPPAVEIIPLPQLTNPGEVRAEALLPSFLFLPGPADFPEGSLALPWNGAPQHVVGKLAQQCGTENAGRLVTSAKSWLSHSGVDRTSPLLPTAAPEGVARVSPVDASRAYLEHIRDAWNHLHPDQPFATQQVLVTVPASFDAAARDLTLKAAEQAGYPGVILLEEPQAAFYAWIERHPDWRERVSVGDRILVVDVGGGTTDFTLIAVKDEQGSLTLERVAVGEHILLGGDNMDLALARHVEAGLAAKGTKLDTLQLNALWQQCRAAKEKLLAEDTAGGNKEKEQTLTVLGRGSSLIGGTIKAKITRAEIATLLEDGFFPDVVSTDLPERRPRSALQSMGLPYANDAGITRHLARFLRSVEEGKLAAPTHVLFNGGVFRATALRERLLRILNAWLAAESQPAAQELAGADLMHAVARGAAYFGRTRQDRGVRIRGGIPRTYYVGIEEAMPAVPFGRPPVRPLTVVPFGMEEGASHRFADREFGLVVGEPAEFRFYVSSTRRGDPAGLMLEQLTSELEELEPIQVTLPAGEGSGVVPVSLETDITETGVLQLWCVARDGRRWKLEFNVRKN